MLLSQRTNDCRRLNILGMFCSAVVQTLEGAEDTLSGAQISYITFVGQNHRAQGKEPEAFEDTESSFSYTNIIQKDKSLDVLVKKNK